MVRLSTREHVALMINRGVVDDPEVLIYDTGFRNPEFIISINRGVDEPQVLFHDNGFQNPEVIILILHRGGRPSSSY